MKNLSLIRKSTLAMLLTLALCLPLFAACSKGKTDETDVTKRSQVAESKKEEASSKEASEKASEKAASQEEKRVYTIGDDIFELTACNIVEDSDGDKDIVTTWKFTNNSEDEKSTTFVIYYEFWQGDKQVYEPGTIFLSKDSLDSLTDYEMEPVKPGETGTFFLCYKLVDEKTPVTIKLSGMLSDEKYTIDVPIEGMKVVTVDDLDVPTK